MKFAYTYRSSDGQRHSAEIEAESRDAAFAKVRNELGVKPIKMTVASGESQQDASSPNQRRITGKAAILAAGVLVAVAIAGGTWWIASTRNGAPEGAADRGDEPSTGTGGYRQETREAILKLIERAGALESRCRAELTLLKLDRLHDYAWIAGEKDLSSLYSEMEKAQSIIDYARSQAKDLFRDIYSKFPAASANERTDAQRRYGELMDALDAEEERMQSEHIVLLLLDEHRSAWKVEQGAIAFTDAKVEEEFRFYSQPTDGSTARWKRDFGHSSIESQPVAIPQKP